MKMPRWLRRNAARVAPATWERQTWEARPELREDNGRRGRCNTGAGYPWPCAMGGIGCDVDHIAICGMNGVSPCTMPLVRCA